jgi:structural maintenance of chromosome 2
VDAALDLSHTQNIGVMLRTHFSESQFIVVSLKEGMFTNANCIFRTKFVDGVSTVTRTVNRVLTNATNNAEEEQPAANPTAAVVTKKKANSKKRVATEEGESQEVEN